MLFLLDIKTEKGLALLDIDALIFKGCMDSDESLNRYLTIWKVPSIYQVFALARRDTWFTDAEKR